MNRHRSLGVLLSLVVSVLSCTSGGGVAPSSQIVTRPTASGTPSLSPVAPPSGPPVRRGTPIRLSDLHGRVAYDCGGDVCIADVDGSNVRRLTHRRGPEFDPSWSPDGTKVAYRDSRH